MNPNQPPSQLQDLGPLTSDSGQQLLPPKARKSRTVFLAPILLVALLLCGGATAYYRLALMQSPGKTWDQAMQRSAIGFEKLVELTATEPKRGGRVEGSYELSSPMAIDGSLEGSWFESTGSFTGSLGAIGVRGNAEIKMIPPAQSKTPDLYIKLDGLSAAAPLLGVEYTDLVSLLDEVDGNWYVLDHTLLDQLSAGTNDSLKGVSTEDLSVISKNLASIASRRLFSSDESVAAFKVESYVGEEEFEGDLAYKYNVIVQRENLVAFATEIKDTLKGTAIADSLLRDASEDSTFEEEIDFDEMVERIKLMNPNKLKAEVWVSKDQKMLRNIRITDDELGVNELSNIDIGFDYKAGDDLEFILKLHNGGDLDNDEYIRFGVILNKSSQAVTLSMDTDMYSDGQRIAGSTRFTVTPSNDQVNVEVPAGAKNALELLELLSGTSPSTLGRSLDLDEFGEMNGYELNNDDSEYTPEEL